MKRRTIGYVLGGAVVVIAIGVAIDMAIVTEEERLEAFVEAVTGEVTSEKIDAALSWIDTSRQPVEVYVMGQSDLYEDDDTLRERARDSMRRFMGQDLRMLNETITVEDERATIRVRVLNDQLGMVTAEFDLRKREETWLVSAVRVTR